MKRSRILKEILKDKEELILEQAPPSRSLHDSFIKIPINRENESKNILIAIRAITVGRGE